MNDNDTIECVIDPSSVMLLAMVEQAKGKTPLDDVEVEIAIVQMREEIVIWLSKDSVQASFLRVRYV